MRPERPTLPVAWRLPGNLDARETTGASIPFPGPLTHTPSPRLARVVPVLPWPGVWRAEHVPLAPSGWGRSQAITGHSVENKRAQMENRPICHWEGGHDRYLTEQVGVSAAYQAKRRGTCLGDVRGSTIFFRVSPNEPRYGARSTSPSSPSRRLPTKMPQRRGVTWDTTGDE